ncbi:MAG: hypothetical protein GY702_01450 [Desulfobulbaceae bacterium]|nr:hypothetical protein [Desulfobulbaceae bacterium]
MKLTKSNAGAFALPFLIIIPPMLERVRGLHSPELTTYVVSIAALFALPFAVCIAMLSRQQSETSWPTRFWYSVLIALCVFMFLDIGFGGMNVAGQLFPLVYKVSLFQRVAIHFTLALAMIGVLSLLAWKLHKDIQNLLLILFGTIFTASLFITDHEPFDNWAKDRPAKDGISSSAPTEIYIVLDAMLGPGGIDRTIPGGQEFYNQVKEFHERHGFALYQNAFSRQLYTFSSLPPALNFDFVGQSPDEYVTVSNGSTFVSSNRLFEDIIQNDRELVVYQTPFINFCKNESINRCKTLGIYNPFNGYTPQSVTENKSFATLIGLKTIARETLTLTYIRLFLKNAFPRKLSQKLFGIGSLPEVDHYSVLSFEHWFSEFSKDILSSGGQSNYFAHFMVPHDPFVLDESCQPKPTAEGGMFITKTEGIQGLEFEERRQFLYQAYFAQASCVYKKLDELFSRLAEDETFDDVRVVLFGDHGSRISAHELVRYLGDRDLRDNYSTLFSVWQRGKAFELIEEQISIQQLLTKRDSSFQINPSEKIVKTVIAPQQNSGRPRINVEILMAD